MSDIKRLLEVRKVIKKKKPDFIRQDAHKKIRINNAWRAPKGMQSQMRHNRSGYGKLLQVGYGSPKAVRGMHHSGMKHVEVSNVKELAKVNPKEEGIIIKSIGMKKKIEIIIEAEKKGIKILNVGDSKKFIANAENKIKSRKENASKKTEARKNKKVTERKHDKEETDDTEELKKEKDKLLIKRDAK
jgi:large subunit ribosomal protein L32e